MILAKSAPVWVAVTAAVIFILGGSGTPQAIAAEPSVTINFRVDAHLLVGSEKATASSVWQLTVAERQGLPTKSFLREVRGEALHVQVEGLGDVFIVRREPNWLSTSSFGSYPWTCLPRDTRDPLAALASFTGPCDLTDGLTMMVSFSDRSDPATAVILNNKDSGSGTCQPLCLTGLTVTRTDQPITTGIEHLLPWLSEGVAESPIGSGGVVDLNQSVESLARQLRNQDFSTEVHRSE